MLTAETALAHSHELIEELRSELKRMGVIPAQAARDMGMSYVGLLHLLCGRRTPTLYWTVTNIEEYLVHLRNTPSKQ